MDKQKLAEERYDKALIFVDKLLPLLHDHSYLNISEVILHSNWPAEEKEEGNTLHVYMFTLLADRCKYIEKNQSYYTKLTDKGRAAKKAGRHFAYEEKLHKEKELAERKESFDLRQKEWMYKTRYGTYLVSAGALIISILAFIRSCK